MLPETLQSILDWVSAHPGLSGLAVFLIAMGESLAVVGMILPGAVLLFGFGALAATGTVALVPTLLAASLGAIVGDTISFWLGRVLKDRLRSIWPFSAHPDWIHRGEAYFHRHGGKSIVFGRFVGPLRAVIPATAGMLGMAPTRFLLIDILSAFAWAPLYLFPGMVFGFSLEIASRVALRLAVLLLIIAVLLWATFWAVRRIYRLMEPHLEEWLARALRWSGRHPVLGHLGAAVVDPAHREPGGLAILGATLILATATFLVLIAFAAGGVFPGNADVAALTFLRTLRTPWADGTMLVLSGLGEYPAIVALSVGVLLWLAVRRAGSAAIHWIAAILFGIVAAWLIRTLLDFPLPPGVEPAPGEAFPNTHMVVLTIGLGCTGMLIAGDMPANWRWVAYAVAALGVAVVFAARLYLGIHWLTDGIVGVCLGIAWTTLVGIAYRRHTPSRVGSKGLAAVTAMALIGSLTWSAARPAAGPSPPLPPPAIQMSADEWWQSNWSSLPASRIDLGGPGSEVMGIQWAGDGESIRAVLADAGFGAPHPFGADALLLPLNPDGRLADRPLLPRAHDGRHEDLVMVGDDGDGRERLVIRLWDSGFHLDNGERVWLGAVSRQRLHPRLGLLHVTRESAMPGSTLLKFLPADLESRQPPDADPPRLLVRDSPGAAKRDPRE